MPDTRLLQATNNEGGTLTAQLASTETTTAHITPVPNKAPGLITCEPGTINEEAIYYKSRNSGAGTISGLIRDYTNMNGGVGKLHDNGSDWETLQATEYMNNIVNALMEGFYLEHQTCTKVTTSSFTVEGNQTAFYTAGRQIRINGSINAVVSSSSYSSPNTTVIVDGTPISVAITSVELAIQPKGATTTTGWVDLTTAQTLTNKTLTSPVINTGISGTAIDTDGTLTANSDTLLASQKAVKTYADTISTITGAPEGFLINGKIVPSVASNNLTVAIKGMDGNDPSAANPVYVRIGNVVRSITAALSVTKNAATNWFNAGSAEEATKEIDYFVYIGYNATDGVVVGFSRIPYAAIYSNFSTTTTNDKYAAISTITTAAAGDNYVNIGRFAATLSAGADYTWTVPIFTTVNLIQRPIYETRWLDWIPVLTNGNADLSTYAEAKYKIQQDILHYIFMATNANVTGSSGTITITLPLAGNLTGALEYISYLYNGAVQTLTTISLLPLTKELVIYKSTGLTNWDANETGVYVKTQNFYRIVNL